VSVGTCHAAQNVCRRSHRDRHHRNRHHHRVGDGRAVAQGGLDAEAARSYHLVERPFLRLRARLFGEGKAKVPPAVRVTEVMILPGLESLLDQSLLRQRTGVDGEPRFELLQTIQPLNL